VEGEFDHTEPITRPQQTVTSPTFPGQLVAFRTPGSHSTDDSAATVGTVQISAATAAFRRIATP